MTRNVYIHTAHTCCARVESYTLYPICLTQTRQHITMYHMSCHAAQNIVIEQHPRCYVKQCNVMA